MNLKQLLPQLNAQVILLGAVLLLVGTFAGNCSDPLGQYNKKFKAFQDSVVAPLIAQRDAAIKADKIHVDSLNKLAQAKQLADKHQAALDADNARLRHTSDEWRQRYLAARASFDTSAVPDTCKSIVAKATAALNTADSTIASKDSIIANRDSTIKVKDHKVTLAEEGQAQQAALAASYLGRAERAERAAMTIPKPPSGKVLGFIPMPDRKTVFIAGFIAGIVVVLETHK